MTVLQAENQSINLADYYREHRSKIDRGIKNYYAELAKLMKEHDAEEDEVNVDRDSWGIPLVVIELPDEDAEWQVSYSFTQSTIYALELAAVVSGYSPGCIKQKYQNQLRDGMDSMGFSLFDEATSDEEDDSPDYVPVKKDCQILKNQEVVKTKKGNGVVKLAMLGKVTYNSFSVIRDFGNKECERYLFPAGRASLTATKL